MCRLLFQTQTKMNDRYDVRNETDLLVQSQDWQEIQNGRVNEGRESEN